MIAKCLRYTICTTAIVLAATISFLFFAYRLKSEGEISLENAWGKATIARESDTAIAHITGESMNAVAYAQGYAHAQTRLWQLEKTRRMSTGELSELFGPMVVNIDKFMRGLGFKKRMPQIYSNLVQEDKDLLDAYADGINDFVAKVDFWDPNSSARVFPPEFYAFGLNKENWRPWTAYDSLALIQVLNFKLSWNWMNDLARYAYKTRDPEIGAITEELLPFSAENLYKLVNVIDDDDLKKMGQFSEETLTQRYHKAAEIIDRANAPVRNGGEEKSEKNEKKESRFSEHK